MLLGKLNDWSDFGKTYLQLDADRGSDWGIVSGRIKPFIRSFSTLGFGSRTASMRNRVQIQRTYAGKQPLFLIKPRTDDEMRFGNSRCSDF